jgi:hypothetical protein
MNSVRRRSHFTGESHQLAYDETAKLVGGEALIPDAQTAAQQWVESSTLAAEQSIRIPLVRQSGKSFGWGTSPCCSPR